MQLAALALIVPAAGLVQVQAQPRMVVDTLFQDFGSIRSTAQPSHRFQISNAGTSPLEITRVVTACGCTTAVIGQTTVAPGQSTALEVTFHAAGFRGLTRKTVEVFSDDPANPHQTLSFQADVQADITPSAGEVLFLDLGPDVRQKKSFKFTSGNGQPIRVENAELSDAPWLGVATREAGNDLWVDLDLRAKSLPADKLYGTDSITLHVVNPQSSLLNLSVHWERRPPVKASPERVAWAAPAGETLFQSLLLEQPAHKPFRILSARTTNPLLQVTGLSPRPAARQKAMLSFSAAARPGVYAEKVLLTLDTPGHPEFEIRVAASLR
jgi:hypothetical protein